MIPVFLLTELTRLSNYIDRRLQQNSVFLLTELTRLSNTVYITRKNDNVFLLTELTRLSNKFSFDVKCDKVFLLTELTRLSNLKLRFFTESLLLAKQLSIHFNYTIIFVNYPVFLSWIKITLMTFDYDHINFAVR